MEGDDMHVYLSLSIMLRGNLQLNLWWQIEYEDLYFGITMEGVLFFIRFEDFP